MKNEEFAIQPINYELWTMFHLRQKIFFEKM